MNWRPSAVLTEVAKNLNCRRWRWTIVGVATAAATALLAAAELRAGSEAVELRERLELAGANVAVVESPSQSTTESAGIDAARCLSLNHQVGIERSGSERVLSPVQLNSAPGSPILMVEATGPLVAIFDPTLKEQSAVSSGTWATTSLRARLGVGEGATVVGQGLAARTIEGVFEPTRAQEMGARLVYSGSPVSRADRCWVETTGPLTQAKLVALSAWFAADAPVVARPLLDDDQLRIDPVAQFSNRSTKDAWIILGVLIGAMLTLFLLPRRAEIALLMTVGTSRLCALGQVVLELLLVGFAAWSAGTGSAILWWRFVYAPDYRPHDALSIALASALLASAVAIALATLGATFLSFGSRLQALKNRE